MNISLQKMYARLDDRDWLLINEDKRPSVITSGSSAVSAAAATADAEREFQIVVMAKQGWITA